MFFRQLLNDETACASYLFGCLTHGQLAVVEPHNELVEHYIGYYVGLHRNGGNESRRQDGLSSA